MAALLLIAPAWVVAEDALPPGFLEFLGTMVESEGELIDPLSMITPAEQVILDATAARTGSGGPAGGTGIPAEEGLEGAGASQEEPDDD